MKTTQDCKATANKGITLKNSTKNRKQKLEEK